MDRLATTLTEVAAGDASQAKALHGLLNRLRESQHDKDDLLQFVAFAMPRLKSSRAQLFQDLWALWTNDQRRGGYFVEFGAGDGVHLSNTAFLETEMGWSGLLAEPNPLFVEQVRANRRCRVSDKCVFSESGRTMDFVATRVGEFSFLADLEPSDSHQERRSKVAMRVEVQTITLNDLLLEAEAPRQIDYLSVDTEGSELEILSAFDFDRWDVRAISVEHNKTPARQAIYELLVRNGYRRQWPEFSRFDDWYVRD
jgi:FkbM family methyltransferase